MPARCILPTCNNNPDKERGIALHPIPFFDDDRPEAKRRRKKWIKFIKSKRGDRWQPTKHAVVCSRHFTKDCFTRQIFVPGRTPRLVTDEIGVVPFPKILEFETGREENENMSERTRRKVSLYRPK